MKTNYFFGFMSLCCLSVFGQEKKMDFRDAVLTQANHTTLGMWVPGKSLDRSVLGTLYLFPEWMGEYKVITKEGDSRQLFNLNYNLRTKKIESSISRDSVFEYDLLQFDYVIKANKKYKVINDNDLQGLLLEVFSSEKIKLYKEATIVVEEGTFNPLTQELVSKDKYVQAFAYYFFIDGKYEKVKVGKKGILKILKDKEGLIKEFVAANKLSYTSDGDLSRILNHYILL